MNVNDLGTYVHSTVLKKIAISYPVGQERMSAMRRQEPSFAASFLMGSAAGAAARTLVAPLERVRLVLQTTAPATSTSSSGFRTLMQTEGTLGLWRGNGLAVVRAVLTKGCLFSVQDRLAEELGPWASGAVAGVAAHVPFYPLDVIRTRIAGQISSGEAPTIVRTARELIRSGGLLALWRGAGATAFGAVMYEGGRFGVFGKLRDWLPEASQHPIAPAMMGVVASLASGCIIYPNDTIRRRIQNSKGGESYLGAVQVLLREGGVPRIYRGLGLYCVKAAPSAAVQFGVYNALKKLHARNLS